MEENDFQPESMGQRLKLARDAIGLSTRDVVALLSEDNRVSHVMLAKYERSVVTPSLGVITELANIYRRHLTWFLSESPRLTGIRYRNSKSKIRQGDRNWFEANAQRWLDAYVRLERRIGQPLKARARLPEITPADDPAKTASEVRKVLGLEWMPQCQA